jgi:hypothetical protein
VGTPDPTGSGASSALTPRVSSLSLIALAPAPHNPLAGAGDPASTAAGAGDPVTTMSALSALAGGAQQAALPTVSTPPSANLPVPPVTLPGTDLAALAESQLAPTNSPSATPLPAGIPEPRVLDLLVLLAAAAAVRAAMRRRHAFSIELQRRVADGRRPYAELA